MDFIILWLYEFSDFNGLNSTIWTKVRSCYYGAQGAKTRGSQMKSWPHPHSRLGLAWAAEGDPDLMPLHTRRV